MASFLKDTWPTDCRSDVPGPPGAEFAHTRIVSLLHYSLEVPLWSHSDTNISSSSSMSISDPSWYSEVNGDKDPWGHKPESNSRSPDSQSTSLCVSNYDTKWGF